MNNNPKTDHLNDFKWKRGNVSPNPNGRGKSLKTMLKTEYNLTQSQTNDILLSLLTLNKSEIENMCNDENEMMLNRIVCKALMKSYNNGSLYALESLLNRTQGLPRQQMDTTITSNQPIFVTLKLNDNE